MSYIEGKGEAKRNQGGKSVAKEKNQGLNKDFLAFPEITKPPQSPDGRVQVSCLS